MWPSPSTDYTTGSLAVLPNIFTQRHLATCPLHEQPAVDHKWDPSTAAYLTTTAISDGASTSYPTIMSTNGAGQDPPEEWKPRDMEGEMRALCAGLKSKVDKFLESEASDELSRNVQRQVRLAKGIIDDALTRYRPDELALSYNGGKDCLVLLILILASLPAHFPPPPSTPPPPLSSCNTPSFPVLLQAIYIRPTSPFEEVDSFVARTSEEYHLDLVTSDKPMKPALQDYLQEMFAVKAVFVGTRRTDPHGKDLSHFQETDGDWPRFMRIHPVIDWHYREVWGFIRALDIPYCPLYDKGYTSLGGTDDTHPNPALKAGESEKTDGFKPAYELTEDHEERLGRDF
ncbi:hypothetical protein SUNI508_06502 [Seiridium unicorne]|uniref:FAD synthase n=1 Tax=Seiridium unicorne TaxID=138068 RepID=A0ABR2UZV7_9PEZI